MAPWLSDPLSASSDNSVASSGDGASPTDTSGSFEPIAIVGMGDLESGRDIETPSALWDFLQQKKDAYSDFPTSRLNIDSWYHPVVNRPGSFYTRGGAFLKADPRDFDPTFFGINPQEAMSLDPAQRKFMEVIYEALESSGTPLEKVSGSKTGCFVGNFNYDHQLMQYRDTEYPEPYGITGGGIALLSNRVSYVLNLQGPSMTLDTACSSSMYALHLACSAIHSGECSAALVGGSNLILTPECQVFSSSLGAVSKSSKCHTFDAAADGYARADGIGALYVKSLRQAVVDQDPIRAIIRGTAINANGKTGGITHPDPNGQEEAIRRAYQRAGIDPALTTYFECHGTGTPVGDPLEIEAVARVFAGTKTIERPLLIGSVKSNMGHCESASGIAGIMKSVLALEHGVIPPLRVLEKLNPDVDLKGGKLKIVQESTTWPTEDVRRASVNSFGYGGANAHTILEAVDFLAPGHAGVKASDLASSFGEDAAEASDRAEVSQRRHFLLPFSAHNDRTLKSNVDALQPVVDSWHLIDVAYTLSCRRSTLSTRAFVIAEQGQAQIALQPDKLTTSKSLGSQALSLGFVFTGQGAQWPQMGLELMESFPTYLRSVRYMDDILRSIKGGPVWSLEASLRASPETSQVYRAEFSQPLVTAVQVALVDLLASWDIRPSVTVGHSSGEIAAVYASGRITAAEAIVTAYTRGQAVSRNHMKGAMLAVGAGVDTIAKHLGKTRSITVACYNSPESITLSGDYEDIVSLKCSLDAEGKFARILSTDGNAYHSRHMTTVGAGYEDELSQLFYRLSSVIGHNALRQATFVSSVTGKVHGKQAIDARYWRRNLESPVLFAQAITNLIQNHSVNCLIEIGPHSALLGPIRQISKSISHPKLPEYIPSLLRHGDGAENLLTLAGRLFMKGQKLNLARVNSLEALDTVTNSVFEYKKGGVVIDLPKYQWTYSDPLYFENRWTREWRLRTHPRHDILGSRGPGGNWNEPVWRNMLRQKDLPWLRDHKIGDDAVFPAAAYLSMAVEAATQMAEVDQKDASMIQKYHLHNVHLGTALIVPENRGTEVLFSLRHTKLNDKTYYSSTYDFTITSVASAGDKDIFTEHASGQISLSLDAKVSSDQGPINSSALPAPRKSISHSQWYDAFERVGLNYGPTFRGLSDIHMQDRPHSAQSRVDMLPTMDVMFPESRYVIHPAAIDSALQLAILAAHDGCASKCAAGFLPISVERMTLWPKAVAGSSALAVAQAKVSSASELSADVTFASADSRHILEASNIVLVASETKALGYMETSSPFTQMTWRPDPSLLTASSTQILYPSTSCNVENAELSTLDQLALQQIVQFKFKHPEFFAEGSSVPHLQRFLSWMAQKVQLAYRGHYRDGVRIVNLSINARDNEIQRLTALLMNKNGPETRLMCHMYESLPAIYRGEISGIHAAVQDHLLDDMYAYMSLYHDGSNALKDLVVLLSHKNPRLKILEVGGGTGSATREVLPALRGHTQYRGYDSYTFTDIGTAFLAAAQDAFREYKGVLYAPFDMQLDVAEQGFNSDYDLIIASNVIHATTNIQTTLTNIRRLLKPGGKLVLFEFVQPRLSWNMILGTFSDFWNGDSDPIFPRTEGPFLTRDIWRSVLPLTGFGGIDTMLDHFAQQGEAAVIMATAAEFNPLPPAILESKTIFIIHRGEPSPFVLAFGRYLESSGATAKLIPLLHAADLEGARCVALLEIDKPLFSNVTFEEWANLKSLALSSHSCLYVTRGGLLDNGDPEHAMVSGLVCAIHTEIQSSRLVTVDLDRDRSFQQQEFENLVHLEQKAAIYSLGDDFEYRSRSGVIHVGRLESNESLNPHQKPTTHDEANLTSVSIPQLERNATVVVSGHPGGPATIHFEEDIASSEELEQDEIEIRVIAVDLGDKISEYPTARRGKPTLLGGSCAGVIARVGCKVTRFGPGDRVFGLYFSALGTLVRTKEVFCMHMEGSDIYAQMATIPAAFCTAMHGLLELGNLAKGETVLITSGISSVGLAACQIANLCGAKVFVRVESGEEHSLLLAQGIQADHIISPEGEITADELSQYNNGAGFHVVLSNANGEEMHHIWESTASHGRFIDLGRTEAFENGRLSMKKFRQNASFSSFDLQSLSTHRPALVASMMQRIKAMHLEGSIKPLPRQNFPVSNINHAFSETNNVEPYGAVLTFEPSQDDITVSKSTYEVEFAPEASYILVGCLGGLGRSLVLWMVSRGVRRLTFLSRTGVVGHEAQDFLHKLQKMAIEVQVIKGDVTSLQDVKRAVKSCTGPIKGIVQAALTLHDSFFSEMTLHDFKSTADPRVKGTLNLHRATEGTCLDFFLMLSSLTTVFGSASQSNYMAANAFMDSFAAYRRKLGLPATSLGLGQVLDVGIVSYYPHYQEHLLRMGLYGNTEDDFLRYCENAIRTSSPTQGNSSTSNGLVNEGHILAGIEPAGLLAKAKRYPIEEMSWYRDPRFSLLVQATQHLASEGDVASGRVAADNGDDVNEAPVTRIHRKLARLLYIAREDIDVELPIKTYGIDSMVAAELRNWLFGAFGVDVPLLRLLAPSMTTLRLEKEVTGGQKDLVN